MSRSDDPSGQLRMIFRGCFILGLAAFFSGCAATEVYTPDTAPEYIVVKAYTPFYLIGPMQAGGPDGALPKDTRVKLLRKEMGYDRVLLDDQRTGYVADEYIALAPPRPAQPAAGKTEDFAGGTTGKRRHGASNGPRYTGDQLNDTPLPDPTVAPPDLNVAPEDIPNTVPTPPPEKPKFRY